MLFKRYVSVDMQLKTLGGGEGAVRFRAVVKCFLAVKNRGVEASQNSTAL